MGKQGGQPFLLGVAMKKIRIVVADHEKSYIESFSAYLRNSEEANRFIPTYFTSWNVLREFLDSNGIMDILLISPKLYDDSLKIPEGTTLIFLEDEDMDHEVDSSRQSVYRYQRLDNLLSNLLSIYYENNQQASKLLARSKKTKVLTVYSPVGVFYFRRRQSLYEFVEEGETEDGKVIGSLKSTGNKLQNQAKLFAAGLKLENHQKKG